MNRVTAIALITATSALAQPVVAPTDAPLGSPRGEDVGGYNITHSFETGYRFRQVDGNLGKYRSDVNFGNGIRLLGSSLSVHSKEGRGHYFDELLLNTQGLGADPYQLSSFRVAKNKLYRYDLLWRLNEYYNPALPVASGQHLLDTSRALQDHNFVLLPQSSVRLLAGYSRSSQNGPALSTTNLLGTRGDEFPLFTNVRRLQNEYRLGFEAGLAGARLSVIRGWEDFRDDTRATSGAQGGNALDEATAIQTFRRDEPYHGSTRSWRVNLLWDRSRLVTVNGRFTQSLTRRGFIYDELFAGTDRFGAAQNRQILVLGSGRRPVTTASLTATIYPNTRLTIANHTAYYNTRMEGDGSYRELDNVSLGFTSLDFSYLGIRTFTNSTDLTYTAARAATILAGYQFSTRDIGSVEQSVFSGIPERVSAEQTNTLHGGRFGVRLQPSKPLSVTLDAEIGRADRPVFPTSERNYHLLGGRVQYKTRTLLLSALVRTRYNTNATSLFAHSSRSRNYSADASWTARPWLSLDLNYSRIHLDTLTGIAYFFDRELIENDRSTYISNIHSGHAAVRFGLGSRADLFVGYSRVQDTGDGRNAGVAAPYLLGTSPAAITPGTLGYQTYPLSFESPMARVSIRLLTRLRWNAGYQHYRYSEELLPIQNYRAHTGFTSLSWSF